MTNKELEERIKELERLAKKHDDDIVQITENVDRLIEEKHKNQQHHEFKVGDRVQFNSFLGAECEGTIFAILDDSYKIFTGEDEFGEKTFQFVNFSNVKKQRLTAIDEPKCKFKVGDKVKGVKRSKPIYARKGEVTQIFNNGIYDVLFEGDFCPIGVFEQEIESYTEPRWTFTDDEKVILRNLSEEYKWIGRDDYGLYIYTDKPYKTDEDCYYCDGEWVNLFLFKHLFQSIKWEDDEACEFRKYL